MSLHRLSAGAGYRYLLRNTACGDVARGAAIPLTAYYTGSGYPPGRWCGAGLVGLGVDGQRVTVGSVVTEEAMAALFGSGRDPVTGAALGRAYRQPASLTGTASRRVAAAPAEPGPAHPATSLAAEGRERGRACPGTVAGFDLTFTAPKSASVLWALADPSIQATVVAAHHAAVDDASAFLQARALFTRTGSDGCAQVNTRGMVAAAFDHWDTRSGDPNLHTHVVLANKVQGPDGAWRSVDSRALHHAAVAVSELYDDLLADQLAARLPVRWGWRSRGARRSPAFEIDGIDDRLLAAFSTRAADIDTALRQAMTGFEAAHGRRPTRPEVWRLRQRATLATRPTKTVHPIAELMGRWADTARRVTGLEPDRITAAVLTGATAEPVGSDLGAEDVDRLADTTLAAVMARRSTWTEWNVFTEAARTTRGLRTTSAADRIHLVDRVAAATLHRCQRLDPPDPIHVPAQLRRPDGASVFTRAGQTRYTHQALLDAEERLLDANATTGAPTLPGTTATRAAAAPQPSASPGRPAVRLAEDQVAAVTAIATSGRRLDVLVGPAGTGKTTTLRALRSAWETVHGRGSVQGLAPSATAAHELAGALAVPCENTAKWLHETVGAGATRRASLLAELEAHRATAHTGTDTGAARRLDAACAALERDQDRWRLRPGQLLIVDEASLAGTLALDSLRAQAMTAGAKLLLVGDHAQLSAVEAGGAFGLLARRGTAHELVSLWRFTHRWEAHATRRLRRGDPGALTDYDEHERIHGGTSEAILEQAYAGWCADQRAGRTAILIAADNHTVATLNERAHTDRLADGTVTGPLVPLGADSERGRAGAGERILTRRNDRTVKLPGGGHVRNGALWTVAAVHPDGGLTVTPAQSKDGQSGVGVLATATVRLPPAYVAEHVDLGYAVTAYRAQGATVDAAHVLASPGMSREAFYVAMTRGRDTNSLYVVTDSPDPACDHLPGEDVERSPIQVLTAILGDPRTEESATETRARSGEESRSLHRLAPIRATIAADLDRRRWPGVLAEAGLNQAQVDEIVRSPASGALFGALRRGETLGHHMARVIASLNAPDDRRVEGLPRDLAAVLHQRVALWLAQAPDLTGHRPDPAAALHLLDTTGHNEYTDRGLQAALDEVDALIRDRIESLTAATLATSPAWLTALTGHRAPREHDDDWRHHLAVVAAHRDLTGAISDTPLGDEPGWDDIATHRRTVAAMAAIRARNIADERRPNR